MFWPGSGYAGSSRSAQSGKGPSVGLMTMASRTRYPADAGLSTRMLVTMFLLGLLYVAFVAVLVALRIPWIFILVIAGGFLFVQYFFSDRIALFSLGGREVSPQEAPELHAIVDRLCALADMPKPKVAIAKSDIPNAFATGRNQRAAVVCATTGIMRRLNEQELEAVLAHELSHVAHRDVAVMTIASFLGILAGFVVRSSLYAGAFGGGFGRRGADRPPVAAGLRAHQGVGGDGPHPNARPARGRAAERVLLRASARPRLQLLLAVRHPPEPRAPAGAARPPRAGAGTAAVKLFDVLLGRSKPKQANLDALFAVTSAAITLEAGAGLRPSGVAAVCFKPASGQGFAATSQELTELLEMAVKEAGSKLEVTDDKYGYRWVVLSDPDLEDLVTSVHLVNSTLQDHGFGDRKSVVK